MDWRLAGSWVVETVVNSVDLKVFEMDCKTVPKKVLKMVEMMDK